jgi:hypothetical protein
LGKDIMDGFSFVVMENATNFLGPFYEAQSAGPDTRLDGLLLKLKLGLKCLKLQKSYLAIKKPKLCPFAQLSGSFKLQ